MCWVRNLILNFFSSCHCCTSSSFPAQQFNINNNNGGKFGENSLRLSTKTQFIQHLLASFFINISHHSRRVPEDEELWGNFLHFWVFFSSEFHFSFLWIYSSFCGFNVRKLFTLNTLNFLSPPTYILFPFLIAAASQFQHEKCLQGAWREQKDRKRI